MAVDVPVTLMGNVVRDPELRYTNGGKAVVSFGIAVNKRVKDGDQWKDGQAHFFDCKAWDQMGENIAESLRQGTRVVVYGELQQRSWETDSGEKRSKVEIQVEAIGPDLRWATAEVVRNERSGGQGGSQSNRSSGNSRSSKPAAKPPTAGLSNPFGNK